MSYGFDQARYGGHLISGLLGLEYVDFIWGWQFYLMIDSWTMSLGLVDISWWHNMMIAILTFHMIPSMRYKEKNFGNFQFSAQKFKLNLQLSHAWWSMYRIRAYNLNIRVWSKSKVSWDLVYMYKYVYRFQLIA